MAETTDDRLRLLIERVERLEEEKKGIADDIRDTYAEAKAVGYDAKIMRQIVRLRKMKPDDRAEMEAMGVASALLVVPDKLAVYAFGDGAGAMVLQAGDNGDGIHGSAAIGAMGGDHSIWMQVVGGGTHAPIHKQL